MLELVIFGFLGPRQPGVASVVKKGRKESRKDIHSHRDSHGDSQRGIPRVPYFVEEGG
jgi:hypothetical protein